MILIREIIQNRIAIERKHYADERRLLGRNGSIIIVENSITLFVFYDMDVTNSSW